MIDEAGARVRLKAMTRPPDLKEIDEEVERLNKEKEEAVANQDFEKAAALRDSGRQAEEEKAATSPATGAIEAARPTASSTKR